MHQRIAPLAILLTLALTACQSAPVVRKPVTIEKRIYVRIDPALTARLPIAMPRNDSGAELLRVARDRRAGQEACNARLDHIGQVEGTPVDAAP